MLLLFYPSFALKKVQFYNKTALFLCILKIFRIFAAEKMGKIIKISHIIITK